ncbi:hypothetical protein LAZ67_16000422 [Cordylochernes scorpioides]|uniref:Reverse transcriptase domain-containing protein n=1 Tax=Cordylochernes scorpioides TaxID=51811 RepID=A0ABY6LE65_9ARAC|nr:hypothetical protein LAZ67_16000422 [Cordylochernes scorpioides]
MEDFSGSEGEEDFISTAVILKQLQQAWINEKLAPELLPYVTEVVDSMLEQVHHMETNLANVRATELRYTLHMLELRKKSAQLSRWRCHLRFNRICKDHQFIPPSLRIKDPLDRIKYVINSYLTCRLKKVTSYLYYNPFISFFCKRKSLFSPSDYYHTGNISCHGNVVQLERYGTQVLEQNSQYLSPQELEFTQQYVGDMNGVLNTVISHMPSNMQHISLPKLLHVVQAMIIMVGSQPNLEAYVFVKANQDVTGVVVEDDIHETRKDRNKEGGGLAFLIKNLYYEDIAINIPNTSDLEAQGNSYQISSKIKFEIKDKKVEKKARKIIHDCKNVTSTHNIFHEKINMKELDYALENTDLNKTPGPDGIHGQMISNLGKNGKEKLLDIFNNSWKTGKLPQDWKTATIIPIKKLDKSADDPKNYRPISLTSICCKLMEKIILRRLTYHLDTRNLLPEEQYGFRKGHGTIDQLLFFTQKVKDAQNRKPTNHTIAAFLDLTQAFDKECVCRDGDIIDLEVDSQHILRYKYIAHLVKNGAVSLF